MKEIYIEVKEPDKIWSRVGGQPFETEQEAIDFANHYNKSPTMQKLGFKYRAVKVEPVVIGGYYD